MKLINCEILRKDYDDLRFGMIDIYCDVKTKKHYMLKERYSFSEEEFKINICQSETRMKNNHPNLLKIVNKEIDDVNMVIKTFLEYPNENYISAKRN